MRTVGIDNRYVEIRAGGITLPGRLTIPPGAQGIVLFLHGSGSSRLSPRNQRIAQTLQAAGLGTLLFDLLTMPEERVDEETSALRFNIDLLAGRAVSGIDWLMLQDYCQNIKLGYFGSDSGAAAAFVTAARRPDISAAVVSRGGRPDLAADHLAKVQAASLLIVGGLDKEGKSLNETALGRLPDSVEKKLEVVPGAGPRFEEPGKIDVVAQLTQEWFIKYLGPARTTSNNGH